MKKITPRIEEPTEKFLADTFRSVNAGAEFVLDAFPQLYKRTVQDMKERFEKNELMLIIDVFNGTALTPRITGQHLLINCSDGISLDGLDKKWNIDSNNLLNKIKSLTIFESGCLEIWANGFWYGGDTASEKNLNEYIR